MKKSFNTGRMRALLWALAMVILVVPVHAIVTSDGSPVLDKLFMQPEFEISNWPARISDLPADLQTVVAADLGALEVSNDHAFYDLRGGRLNSLILARPLVPGPGVGNGLSWSDLGLAEPATDLEYGAAVFAAFESFLAAHNTALGIDSSEFEAEPMVNVLDKRRLTQIHVDRVVDGVPVRFDALTASVNSGNLILYGVRNWGAIDVSTIPSVSAAAADAAIVQYLAPHVVAGHIETTRLELLPQSNGAEPGAAPAGSGYTYRLAWIVTVAVENDHGTYEGVVDAHSGDVLAVTDLNNYLTRRTVGGIYPVSNDGQCQGQDCLFGGKPDGIEQPGHPMPFANLTLGDGSTVVTNSGGLAEFDGSFSADLTGPYVQMTDTCGFADEQTVCTDLDFGQGPGTDCAVPAGADSLGNTHSGRTGFYELNRLIEGIRSRTAPSEPATFAFVNGQIPVVTPVTANMNLPLHCNAFFTPALPSINFYREGPHSSGTVICRNTGEIAAVFDHEFGHFLDDFDGNGLSSPSEAYADIVGITRLNDSCVARGFFKSFGDGTGENEFYCTSFGNTCTSCTGVREDDFLKKIGMEPSGVDWALSSDPDIPGGCAAPSDVPLPAPGLQSAPCGGSVHCNGVVPGEAMVDLFTRDLLCMDAGGWERVPGDNGPVAGGQCAGGATPSMDANTALEIATILFYEAKSNIGFWFACNNTVGGCPADSGYQQILAADDDNGNLLDGTPHIEAIFAAFDRHQIACPATAPPLVNASCGAGTTEPAQVTGLTATATVNGADLTWDPVPLATEYWVFRTEGVLGCEQGKTRLAVLNALLPGSNQYSDVGSTLDGMEQYYTVMAVGTPGCYGDLAECAVVTPLSPGGSNDTFSVGVEQGDLTLASGDGDVYLDNCESANLAFDVANNGTLSLSNVKIVDIRPVSHPQTAILTAMPISLGGMPSICGGAGTVSTAVDFQPLGMNFDETLILEVDILADEFNGVVQTGQLVIRQVESEDGIAGDAFFDFESGNNDWTATSGAFERSDAGLGGAPNGSTGTFYQASSGLADNACDVLQSPVLKLTPTSTLSLFNQFDIEPQGQNPYDRANVSLLDMETGLRFVLEPDGGLRPYDIPGGDNFGGCNGGEAGWSGPGPTWVESTFSDSAIQAAVGTIPAGGKSYRVQVIYGTDASAALTGFQFDQVTVTNVFSRGPDAVGPAMCQGVTNLKPVANDDAASTLQGNAVVIPVLTNDSDPDAGDVIAITNVTNGVNGSAADSGGGNVTYTPDPAFFGTDVFSYTICDDGSPVLCDSAVVTVTVLRDENACVEPGIEIHTDPEGDAGFLGTGTGLPQHDVLSFSLAQDDSPSAGTFVFTLEMASLEAPLPVNTTWPVVFQDHLGASRWVRMWTDENGVVAFAYGAGTNPGPFGNPGTAADPSSSFDADGTIRIVVPGSAFPGVEAEDTFTNFITRIRIEAGGSAVTPDNMPDDLVAAGSYTVKDCGVNLRPVAEPESYNVDEGDTLVEGADGVLDNDSDPNGDTLEAELVSGPSLAVSFALATDGSFTYEAPMVSGNQADTFVYRACDRPVGHPDRLCSTPDTTVTINIVDLGGGNQPPVAGADGFSTAEDTALADTVATNDSDPDGDPLDWELLSSTAHGALVFNTADGSFTYTPDANYHGSDGFTYRLCDNPPNPADRLCVDATATITVTAVNDRPTATDDAYATDEDTLLVIASPGVLGNDDDLDGDGLRSTLVSGPSNGTLNLELDGSFSYSPTANYNGPDAFSYRACDRSDGDPGQLCDVADVQIQVTPVNDPPMAMSDEAATAQDTAITIDVLANDSDPENDPLSVDAAATTDGDNGTTTVNPDNTVTYTPDAGFFGTDFFSYTVCDDKGLCDATTVTVTVIGDGERCDLCADGKPAELTLTYLGGDCSQSDNTQGGKAECTDFAGPPPADADVFIVASDDEDADSDSDREWFRGTVSPDGAFTLLASAEGKDDFGSKVFVHVFASDGGALLQTLEIHTSCSAPLVEGDRFGSVAAGDAANPGECPVNPGDGEGRVHGSGHLDGLMSPDGDADSDSDSDSDSDRDSDSEKVDFSFDAKFKNGELKGKLKLHDKELDVKIDAKTITSLSPGGGLCNGVATSAAGGFEFTAVGEFNGIPGAEFRVCGEDNGKPGKGDATHPPDRFFLECLMGCTYETASRTPDDGLDGGNIHLHDAIVPPGSGGGGAGLTGDESASSEPEVIDLDPIVLGRAIAGAPQVLTAVLSTPSGLPAVGSDVTLHWKLANGATGTASSVTDDLGAAVFLVTIEPGDARYWVEVDGLESNGIAITGAF